jgi:MFS family permease
MVVMHALDPILAVQLLDLGVGKEWVGTAFTTIYLANLVSSPAAGKMSDQISFAWVQRLGCITTCISMFFIGPSQLLPGSVELMFAGFAVIGISCSLVFVPAVP